MQAVDSGTQIYYYANYTTLASFSMNPSGLMGFTPLISELGNHTITVWVTHNLCPHAINWSTFVMEIRRLNNFPYWVNLTNTSFVWTENQNFHMNLSLNATDKDNDPITFAINRSLAGYFPNFSITPKGFINFTPSDVDVCNHVVNITISDGNGGFNSSVFNFTVNNINEPPVLSAIPDQQLCENVPYDYTVSAYDTDVALVPCISQYITYQDNTTLFTIGESSGRIIFTPTDSQAGLHNVRIYAIDNAPPSEGGPLLDYKDVLFDIIRVNDAPVLGAIGSKTIRSNNTLNINATAFDEEGGNTPICGFGGCSGNANLTFNSTFFNGTKFFDIDPSTGVINLTTNDSLNGTYLVQICVNDSGILSSNPNATLLCGDGKIKSDCENISISIVTENLAPNILSYFPLTNVTINETQSQLFYVLASDPEGNSLNYYWYKDGTLVSVLSSYNMTTQVGDAGNYTMRVNVTDGELNATVSWIVEVLPKPQTPIQDTGGTGGGGGGGGGSCSEIWTCNDWSFCQNANSVGSQIMLQDLSKRVLSDCRREGINESSCGFQIRECNQFTSCKFTFNKPIEVQPCTFTEKPTCTDGIKNCHDGSCEILTDCGGPCPECSTCSDGLQNQGEDWIDCGGPCSACTVAYPKPPKCGDKRCEVSELFNCWTDCGIFWIILTLSVILIMIIIIISRRELILARLRAIRTAKMSRQKYFGNLLGLLRQSISDKDVRVSKELYLQIKQSYEHLPSEEKKKAYPKMIKLYAEIQKLEEQSR
jgi:hypothetical protein